MTMLVLLIVVLTSSHGSDTQPCPGPEAHQFDFWIGDWVIKQKILQQDGSWLKLDATTSVSPAIGGCAIVEHWEGSVQFFWEGMKEPEQMKGLSVRAYDPRKGTWSIHWMDSRNPSFGSPYVGNFHQGRGEFVREWESPQGRRTGRIVFSDITVDTVHWELSISTDEGATWTALWIMEMRRSGK